MSYFPTARRIRVSGTTLTLDDSHNGVLIEGTGASLTITVPTGLSPGFSCGAICSGGLTVSAGSGMTADAASDTIANKCSIVVLDGETDYMTMGS